MADQPASDHNPPGSQQARKSKGKSKKGPRRRRTKTTRKIAAMWTKERVRIAAEGDIQVPELLAPMSNITTYSNMDLQELVRVFNSLPRSPKTPSGLVNNHWQFAVQHVPLNPPADSVHLLNGESRYNHCEGRAQILSCPSVAAQADIVLPLLLKAFVNWMGMKPQDPSVSPSAPWSWGTGSPELARALEERLNSVGIRKELCTIKVENEENVIIEQEEWAKIIGKLKGMVAPKCNKCKKGPTEVTKKLQLCGGCKKAQYCSTECQKLDWKGHKIVCKKATTGSTSSSSVGAVEYYQTIAPNMSEAKALASEIGLTLPCPDSRIQGLSYPIRRLVVTGKDTPKNIVKLVGPNEKDIVRKIHESIRFEVLLWPPPGSPMYASSNLDGNCPPWKPREASAAENEEVTKVKDMQELIRRHMGSRSMSEIDSNDMRDVLVTNFGGRRTKALLSCYEYAVNAMDGGVPAG